MNEEYKLNPVIARRIIDTVGGTGTPPEFGFQFFTAGLDEYLNVIEEEYLKSYVMLGGSVFKMVVGIYGGGKTHFLYNVREIAWKHNYVSAYITLHPNDTPFSRLEKIYEAIVSSLIYKQTQEQLLSSYDRGIEAIIKKWYLEKYKEFSEKTPKKVLSEMENYTLRLGPYESTTFKNAVKNAFLSLAKKEEQDFGIILQWLKGEQLRLSDIRNYQMNERIDNSTALKMIRSLAQWIVNIGYSGLIVLLDEAEQTPSMSTRDKNILLSNLRELIDLCSQINFKNTMWLYAVPDETFLEGKTNVYEALRQRVTSVFNAEINPTGVKIRLDDLSIEPIKLLKEIGNKLSKIYEKAKDCKLDEDKLRETVANIAEAAYERRYDIGYKREFVRYLIPAFNLLLKNNRVVTFEDIEPYIK